ncbi:MAG: GNAT family N-acetyltransferase [Chloroflexi bacterium]|nr:GNAT family N-acetyltransferase [Chloroflexota bacterium]
MPTISFHPLTPERWTDFERLFGTTGGVGGCWCMHWRTTNKQFVAQQGAGNRQAMRALVEASAPVGILACVDEQPAGWCSLSPRDAFPRLKTSKVFQGLDGQPVWAIVCFFIARAFRRQRLSARLLQAALDYARARGAQIVEACPVEPQQERMPEVFAFTGIASVFYAAGFVEVARRSPTRPLLRYYFEQMA